MCNYLNDNNNQREIFVETIQEKLIGPGSNVFGLDKLEELIDKNPVKLYYSGILFSKAFSNPDAIIDNEEDEFEEIELDQAGDAADDDNMDDTIEVKKQIDDNKDDMASANLRFQSYYPNKFGLVFAVNGVATNVDVTLNYAIYSKTAYRKIKISAIEWADLQKAINKLNDKALIGADFGEGFFALDKFTYEGDILSFSYNPPKNKTITDKKYINEVKEAFSSFEFLKNKFIKQLCARNVFKRKQKSWNGIIDFINKKPIDIPDTSLQLYSKVMDHEGKKIVKLLVQNNNDTITKSYKNCYFQVHLKANTPHLTDYKKQASSLIDQDFATVDYQYQDIKTYGKGISCAVSWQIGKSIETTFLPQEEIKNFSNAPNQSLINAGIGEIFKLKNLSIWTKLTQDEVIAELEKFTDTYDAWYQVQLDKANGDEIGIGITQKQSEAVKRLKENIKYLAENSHVYESFKLANTAMLIQMIIAKDNQFEKGRAYNEIKSNSEDIFNELAFFQNYDSINEPIYRPFQLAFLLMNIEPTFNKASKNRADIVDLIWFPTGGGKTEAYLALTALTIIERRRHNADTDTSGVSVMMRYTLRLLTAQQFQRATYLICALEFLRKKLNNYDLGDKEITIGMWVGGSTTPNSLKDLNDNKWDGLFRQQNVKDAKKANKFPISYCPWCGCDLITEKDGELKKGFESGKSEGLDIYCINTSCVYNHELPISFIDEVLYKKPPTLLFATVDKIVQLSHKKEAGELFNSHLPLDLIIQDELHLLTGPLGSLTALYEIAIEQLCNKGGRKPKIVASTATTRNTTTVIKSMYGRALNVFPAQGVRFNDNFFSFLDDNPKRKHIGVMPTGKTAGLTEIKIVEALYEAKIKLLKYFLSTQEIDSKNIDILLQALNSDVFRNKIDPYWTFVFYYNNLRDLGRSKSRVSIDFTQQIEGMFKEQGFENALKFVFKNLFSRTVEFTSRQESGEIKGLLSRTEQNVSFSAYNYKDNHYIAEQDGSIDLALASNMFSVGIDVNRLNIMLMVGQPGSVAEYIQASSRVARRDKGLVINLLNPMRARELSIFEDYTSFHSTYYKNVEPLSITPFTEMAIDKLLDAVLVAYVRTINKVNTVQGFNTAMKDKLKEIIRESKRALSEEQQTYLDAKLDILSARWVKGQQDGTTAISKNQNQNNYIFDLMNSLRDIDYDVYIKNQSY